MRKRHQKKVIRKLRQLIALDMAMAGVPPKIAFGFNIKIPGRLIRQFKLAQRAKQQAREEIDKKRKEFLDMGIDFTQPVIDEDDIFGYQHLQNPTIRI